MTDDGSQSEWGPWALVAGVGLVGVLGLARELRDRRRDDEAHGRADEATDADADAGTDTDTDAGAP